MKTIGLACTGGGTKALSNLGNKGFRRTKYKNISNFWNKYWKLYRSFICNGLYNGRDRR